MKILTGHLTASEKKIVKAILNSKIFKSGIVGKKHFFTSEIEGVYTVKIQVMDRGLIPCPSSSLRLSTYTSTFSL